MDGGCSSASSPSDSGNVPAASDGGASKFLTNLPSRGHFSSTVLSANPGGMRVYICEHDTSPPDGQVIKTNQTNILIRSLMLQNQKGDSGSKGTANQGSRKRPADKPLDSKAAGKRAMSSSQPSSYQDLQSLTVEKLRALLREKGLPARGKKEDLIKRLREIDLNG